MDWYDLNTQMLHGVDLHLYCVVNRSEVLLIWV